MSEPPERFNVSVPPDDPLGLDDIDAAVEASEYESRSAFVRAAIRGEVAVDDVVEHAVDSPD